MLALFRGAQRRRLDDPVLAVGRSRADARAATLTVERVKDGEVSPIFWMSYASVDQLELRGPIGGYFVWTGAAREAVYLLAGGTGITPLMSMLRHRDRRPSRPPALLIYSARSWEDIFYRDELEAMMRRDSSFRLVYALTRQQPQDWTGHRGRINKGLLSANWFPPAHNPTIYICGPTTFVETVASLVELGFDPLSIKTERFGPSGG